MVRLLHISVYDDEYPANLCCCILPSMHSLESRQFTIFAKHRRNAYAITVSKVVLENASDPSERCAEAEAGDSQL